jgi:FtsP/CotA-like multicopper oxidase with cupredoxin domain
MKRRELLYGFGITALGLAAGRLPGAFARRPFFAEPDVDLTLIAAPGHAQILPGPATDVWRFTGVLHKGPADTLQVIPGSYLGPIIRLRKRQKVRIRFRNNLPEDSIVHWHGLDVPEAADGHPRLAVGTGGEYVYEFEVINRAGTYWYHPHPHHRTGSQVYRGLAGLMLVTDDEETALGLPGGDADLAWVLQDRTFDAGNQLTYLGGGMMDQMHGLLGSRVLVNGSVAPRVELGTKPYRIRLLNGSSARVYKLMWDDGTPMTVVAVDGGLLERRLEQKYLTLAPAQRAEVVLDLSRHRVGSTVQLRSDSFPESEVDATQTGMMGGAGGGRIRNGTPLPLTTITVARKESSTFRLPSRLASYDARSADDASAPVRRITLDFRAGQWLLGGRTFGMLEVAPDEIVAAGSSQIWEIANVGGMMGRQMAHPFHVHGTQFRVISRVNSAAATPGESLRDGVIDAGWRDTVLVMPGETVRLLMRFTKSPGLYLYHCHILEHEDMGMMRNFRVTA